MLNVHTCRPAALGRTKGAVKRQCAMCPADNACQAGMHIRLSVAYCQMRSAALSRARAVAALVPRCASALSASLELQAVLQLWGGPIMSPDGVAEGHDHLHSPV